MVEARNQGGKLSEILRKTKPQCFSLVLSFRLLESNLTLMIIHSATCPSKDAGQLTKRTGIFKCCVSCPTTS
eukprot:2864209-Amphidinium_carterae.1